MYVSRIPAAVWGHQTLMWKRATQGAVRAGAPYLTKIGEFEVDVAIEGQLMLIRQQDKPGLIAAVSTILAADKVNVAFMTCCRVGKGEDAIMAIGIDSLPSDEIVAKVIAVDGIVECGVFTDL